MSRKDASRFAARAGRSDFNGRGSSSRGFNKRRWFTALGAVAVVAVCVAIRMIHGPEPADAKAPAGAPAQQAPQKPQIVAVVNGQEIGRQELAQECLAHYGKEVLETMMNRFLISQYCQQAGVTVTPQEITAEIDQMSRKFGLTSDQFVKMLQQERGITPEQYGHDIVWPTLALKKLAANRIEPTQEELQKAFDAQFGEAVKTRLIVLKDQATANKVWGLAKANPDDFGALAKHYSIDPSASVNGLIQPIHHGVGDERVEKAAFQLRPNEISGILPVGDQFLILKCEGWLAASNASIDQVKDRLAEAVRETKLHKVAGDLFKDLQKKAQVQNIFNDPVKSAQMPGVAALINGRQITLRELAEDCIDRHGKDALEGIINRHLLEQALHGKGLTVTQQDLDTEITRAAVAVGKLTPAKQPDIQGWLKMVTTDQGITYDTYIHDAVWPSVALKKLTTDVEVTPEDLDHGYQASFGPRCKARVIVLNNQRKAQEVWELAQKELQQPNPRPDFFGKLAEQYSIDPSRTMQGRVPPIQKYGGAHELEEQAFALKAGEISGIINISGTFVILYCEGYTQPQKIEMAEVRDELYADIHEKKMKLAMADQFHRLQEQAQIDNVLAGTTQTPKSPQVTLDRAGGRQGAGKGESADSAGRVIPAGGQQPIDLSR